jgi:hypothetical protein
MLGAWQHSFPHLRLLDHPLKNNLTVRSGVYTLAITQLYRKQ